MPTSEPVTDPSMASTETSMETSHALEKFPQVPAIFLQKRVANLQHSVVVGDPPVLQDSCFLSGAELPRASICIRMRARNFSFPLPVSAVDTRGD
ncbi:hypothetical protein PoMZ_00833 [Pyricularia oryzae]|uniref:Uncharacterized protein n=1 Tax=Pyricularia oryzae TaxID=318829 RepID=A0A4P7N0S7_PYROR|nr:hypothetical protein PoMZ_00833 [Pyricularia oryzae]